MILNFSEKAAQRVEEIRVKGNHADASETVTSALALYEWFLEQREKGAVMLMRVDNELFEVKFETE